MVIFIRSIAVRAFFFFKAGKTLAGTLAKHGEEVLIIEKDPNMYGGTCINVGCLPTKNMIINAHRGIEYEVAFPNPIIILLKCFIIHLAF